MTDDALRAALDEIDRRSAEYDELQRENDDLRAALAASATDEGHEHARDCDCLPIRVVVDQHGHYWRDYGDHWSMCPVSTENVATEPVTEFYRFGGDLDEGPRHECAYPYCNHGYPGLCDNPTPHGPHQRSETEACPGIADTWPGGTMHVAARPAVPALDVEAIRHGITAHRAAMRQSFASKRHECTSDCAADIAIPAREYAALRSNEPTQDTAQLDWRDSR